MVRVLYDLETRFKSLGAVQYFLNHLTMVYPEKPLTAGVEESSAPARICVAPTVEDCISGITPDWRFRRCLGDGQYKNENEIYPIIILVLDGESFYRPSPHEVPDVDITNEHWYLKPAKVLKKELRWIGHDSIKTNKTYSGSLRCTRVEYVKSTIGFDHPWLNGKGHPLECSYPAQDAWPDLSLLYGHLFYETYISGKVCYVLPELPATGYCECTPIDGSAAYRARLHNCRQFTGYWDVDGRMICDGDLCSCGTGKGVGTVKRVGATWCVVVEGTKLYTLGSWDTSRIVNLEHHNTYNTEELNAILKGGYSG